MAMMKILGMDPGSRTLGYGLIALEGRSIKYLSSGVLRFDTSSGLSFNARLQNIFKEVHHLVQTHLPSHVAIESLIFAKSPSSAMKLAQTRGAMVAACHFLDASQIFEYAPNRVKLSLTGHGHADKLTVQKVLRKILNLGHEAFISHDESDALSIAICHALHAPWTKKIISSSSSSMAQSVRHRNVEKT